jgi:hypothetical protein
MKRTWLGFFVLVFPLLAVGQNNVTTGSLALGQRVSANGHTTLASSGPIFDTTQFAGGGIAADIADCLTALATGPGTCDASSEPAQTTAATIKYFGKRSGGAYAASYYYARVGLLSLGHRSQ